MADEIYRQERPSINPRDLKGRISEDDQADRAELKAAQAELMRTQQQFGHQQLDEIAQVRKAAAEEVGEDYTPTEGGFAVQGNLPPAFQQARNALRQQEEGFPQVNPQSVQSPVRPKKKQIRYSDAPSEMRMTGSSRLEELIGVALKATNFEPLQLPSRGRFYNGSDGPTDGIIHVKPMTGSEEEILATPRFIKKGQAINMIFNRCMREKYNTENFLTIDRTYLLLYLRGISYTPFYEVEVECPECGNGRKIPATIDLDGLNLEPCPDNFSIDDLTDTLPRTGFHFTYSLSKGRDEQAVQDYRERKLREFDTAGQADDTLLFRTATLVDEIEGLTDKTEIQVLLTKLPIEDVAYLRTVVNEPPFGVDTKVEISCPFCQHDFDVELPLDANFFFPRQKRKTPTTQSSTQH